MSTDELPGWLAGEGFRMLRDRRSTWRRSLGSLGSVYVTPDGDCVSVSVTSRHGTLRWSAQFSRAPLPVVLGVVRLVLETPAT